jgi:3-deoxy-D-manno-octulosonic-acid transferase
MRVRAWFLVYNVVLHLGALVCLPFWLFVRIFRGRYRGQFLERMGILAPEVTAPFGETPAIWVHAASAGETASATPLVRALRRRFPDRPLLFTVTSKYGKAKAESILGGDVDSVCFSPLDLPLFCRRFLDRIRPALYVMVETDLWPNLVRKAKRRGAAIAIASGHAGPRSFPRSFWAAAFSYVDLMLMQSERDAQNIVRRGAAPDRVHVMGNLKFDSTDGRLPAAEIPAWRAELGLPDGVPVLVAGSTHPEDEGPLLDAVARLRAEGLDLHAVIAPRRDERVPEIEAAAAARDLEVARRTSGARAPVLVLDTMGELARTYNVADVAYVGGGFTEKVGLHSLLEPLVCEAPVLFGPHHGKAARIAAEVRAGGAGMEVADGAALVDAVRTVLTDAGARARLANAGRELLGRHQGAASRQAARIGELLA